MNSVPPSISDLLDRVFNLTHDINREYDSFENPDAYDSLWAAVRGLESSFYDAIAIAEKQKEYISSLEQKYDKEKKPRSPLLRRRKFLKKREYEESKRKHYKK